MGAARHDAIMRLAVPCPHRSRPHHEKTVTADEAGQSPRHRGALVRIAPVLILAAVVSVVLATYWPALSAQARYMDDRFYLGPLIRHPSFRSLGIIFREVLAPSTVNGYYQPLALASLMLDFLDPAAASSLTPFHRTTLLLHLLNVVLVATLLRALFRNWLTAGLLALLYGLHPLNADAVVWIAERKTVLSTSFVLCSLLFYLAYVRQAEQAGRGRWKPYAASLFTYLCALLSKPAALPMVAALFVLDYWPLGRLGRKTLREKVPFLVLAVASGVVTLVSQSHSGNAGTVEFARVYYVPLMVAYGLGFYILKIILPVGLVSDYPPPWPFGLTNLHVAGNAMVALGAALAVAVSIRRSRAWLVGGLFFVLTVLPTLGLIRFTASLTTNRSMYLPMVGLLIPLQWELASLWRKGLTRTPAVRVVVAGAGAALALASAYATRSYTSHWRDNLTLLHYYLSQEPDDYRLHTRLGNEWIQRGDHRSAIVEFRKAIGLKQDWTENHLNLGRALFTVGQYSEASEAFATALGQTPNDWRAHMLMGLTQERLGSMQDALREFESASRIAPKAAQPHFDMARILGQQGKQEEAAREYQRTLALEPRFTEARLALDALRSSATDGPGSPRE
jgi:protein O-mannosyl-transferase